MDLAAMFNNPLLKGAKKAVVEKGIKFIVVDTSQDKWKGAAFLSNKVVMNQTTLDKLKSFKDIIDDAVDEREDVKELIESFKLCLGTAISEIETSNKYE